MTVSEEIELDRKTPHLARIHNYAVGGEVNFAADREAAQDLTSAPASELETLRPVVRAIGAFVLRTVRYLAEEAGITQYLTTATPVPTTDNIHDVVQRVAPEARVVYAGSDPVVMAHAHVLRKGTASGYSTYVYGSERHPQELLVEAAKTLDFTQPVALLLPTTLGLISDEEDPYGAVDQLLAAVPSGSYLVVAHITGDIASDWVAEAAPRLSEAIQRPFVARTRAEIERFFAGLTLVDDGVVHVDDWRRHENKPLPAAENLIPVYGGVARKP